MRSCYGGRRWLSALICILVPDESADSQDRRIGRSVALDPPILRIRTLRPILPSIGNASPYAMKWGLLSTPGSVASAWLVTNGNGNTIDRQGYYAHSRDRRSSELRTPQRFTGRTADVQESADRCSADNNPRFPAHPRFSLLPFLDRRSHLK